MKKDATIFLEDILKNIELIEEFTKDMTKDQFMKDIKTQYSVNRGIEIIGEATKNLPKSITDKYQDIPWKDIRGMRDKLIHAYFGVNLDSVWLVIKDDLPDLKIKIMNVLGDTKKQ